MRRFLDEKTARIDGLIEKKRALLDRLAEKRQALITRAVTKGLDPDAPMKPTDIDWLGEIPDYWETGNIRRFAEMRTGHTPSRSHPEYWDNCTIPWFTLADVWQLRDGTRWYLNETAEKISEIGLANSAAELLPAGTVVFFANGVGWIFRDYASRDGDESGFLELGVWATTNP